MIFRLQPTIDVATGKDLGTHEDDDEIDVNEFDEERFAVTDPACVRLSPISNEQPHTKEH